MAQTFALVGLIGFLAFSGGAALAQTPPTPMELSAYRGLHASAAQDSVNDIRRLARAGADPNARDGMAVRRCMSRRSKGTPQPSEP